MTGSPTAHSPGRPREFDEGQVLDRLVELFWEKGFEATSLTDITDAAGLNKSSLYNAFGSKDQLYRRVLGRYLEHRAAMLAPASEGHQGLDDLTGILEMQRAELRGDTGRFGCLAVNSGTELGLRNDEVAELSRQSREMLSSALRGPLTRAALLGEIDPDLVEVYVNTLVSCSLAMMVDARCGAGADELVAEVDSMERLVESWRL